MSIIAEFAVRSRAGRGVGRRLGALTGFEAQISANADDGLEYLHTGSVVLDGGTLFLAYDGGVGLAEGKTLVAVRFPGVTLAQSESVSLARLRFVASNGNAAPVLLRVWCEAADDSAALTTAAGSLSARAKTTAYYDWDVPEWGINQDDASTRTDELAPLVQEVVNRAGWQYGNALSFLIELSPANTNQASPRRRAYSYEGSPDAAARTNINAIEAAEPPPPPPPGDFSDGHDLFGLEGSEVFDPNSPVLKDGTAFTAAMGTYYDAFMYALLNSTASWGGVIESWQRSNVQTMCRESQTIHAAAMGAFRLTGDLRILDRIIEGFTAMDANMSTGWVGHDCAAIDARDIESCCGGAGWAPNHPILRWSYSGQWSHGTDMRYMYEHQHRADIAMHAWVLHQNRGKTSPAGHNYAALADHWGARVERHVYVWSANLNDCWATANKRGVGAGGPWHSSGARQRSAWGEWPLTFEASYTIDNSTLNRYTGLLGTTGLWSIENPSDALASANETFDLWPTDWVECTDSYGRSNLILRGTMFSGTRYGEPLRSTYTGYTAWQLINGWFSGAYSALSATNMLKLARAWADMSNTDGSTKGNLAGDVDRCAHGLNVDAGSSTPTHQVVRRGLHAMSIFADESESGGSRLFDAATAAQNASGGGYGTPTHMNLPAGQFITRALQESGWDE